jgi:TDG/mug DNA glycosylase family protein
MANSVGFPAVARRDARVLVLGTFPSVESLNKQQYYANKRNSFWKIMGELVGAFPTLPYDKRIKLLEENGIALWDVCAAAQRAESLDSNIESHVANDFVSFFKEHADIKLVCFNGQSAEKLFRQYVKHHMPENILLVPFVDLPSTSPAHASMRFDVKLSRWRNAFGAQSRQELRPQQMISEA